MRIALLLTELYALINVKIFIALLDLYQINVKLISKQTLIYQR